MGATISKFTEALILAAVFFFGVPAAGYLLRSRSLRYKSVPKSELLRSGFEVPLIVFVIFVPISYMWYHAVRYSGIYTCVLGVIGLGAVYVSISFAQRRNRTRRQSDDRFRDYGSG